LGKLGKSAKETLVMIRQEFGEESLNHTQVFEWHAQTRRDQKKARQVKIKVKSILFTFCDIKELVHKVNFAHYCDI
jgi:hypothetical protein